MTISANQENEVPGSTVAHELVHRLQFLRLRFGPDRGMDCPPDLTDATWSVMKSRGAKLTSHEFWAYGLETYVNEP